MELVGWLVGWLDAPILFEIAIFCFQKYLLCSSYFLWSTVYET
jgi:hypothetical protein